MVMPNGNQIGKRSWCMVFATFGEPEYMWVVFPNANPMMPNRCRLLSQANAKAWDSRRDIHTKL